MPLLFVRFHTFNGLVAGTALLSVTAGLKLLETKTQRDIYIITLIIYFVSLAALLEGDLLLAAGLFDRGLLAHDRDLAALDQQRHRARVGAAALRYGGRVSGAGVAAGVGVLAAVSAICGAPVAYTRVIRKSPHRA